MALMEANTRFGDLCRLCATKTSSVLGLNIFENEGNVRQINKKIQTCLPIQVDEGDELPKMICGQCLYKLEQLFEFHERSLRTESLLMDLLKEIACSCNVSTIDMLPAHSASIIVESVEQEMILGGHPSVGMDLEGMELSNGGLHPLEEPYRLDIQVDDIMLAIKDEEKKPLVPAADIAKTKDDGDEEVKENRSDCWYYCNMCGKSVAEKDKFEEHYEEHFTKCSGCLAVFSNKDALDIHRKENRCESEPEAEAEAEVEEIKVVQEEPRTRCRPRPPTGNQPDPAQPREENKCKVCKECGKSYKTNYKLAEHMRKHTGEQPFKCGSCEKAFRSKIGLAQHEAKHTGEYEFSCPTCGKGFQCKSYLVVHQRVHSDLKPYPCTTCGRNFKTKQSLLDHMNRHLGVKPYMCDVCGRAFITKGLCKSHQKIHTGIDNRKYSCKVCQKMFVSKSYLQTHLRIHTGEKPFMCEVCGKGFLTRVDLRIHSTMHTGEKSYVCEMCGKAFARRDALRCHRRSHTGERPYTCEVCGQTFTQFSPMAIHKRLHTGERPYACEVCNKAFVSRSTMMAHFKKHR